MGRTYSGSVGGANPALAPIAYGPDDQLRKVRPSGQLSYRNRVYFISHALAGQWVALRPTAVDGVLEVVYCRQPITQLDVRAPLADALDS